MAATNCPQCQHLLRESARFCDQCGLPIPSSEETIKADNIYGLETLPVADPLIGRVLDARYELIGRLGDGGMGIVYLGRHVLMDNRVAIKILHPKYVTDRTMLDRFRLEARAAANLNHPNVVTIHDFGEAQGDEAPAYIVMELLEGPSLREFLRREGPLQPERAVPLMREVCYGVGAAHRRQIVHRDLKPENIVVLEPSYYRKRETVKVVDFGIAKLRDLAVGQTLTLTGQVLGTPFYMSPEQCRGDKLDVRSDVYSLGVIMYEMLSGRRPFEAATFTGVCMKHLSEPPPPFPDNLAIPSALEIAIRHALAKDPDTRQEDAIAFARDLQAAGAARQAMLTGAGSSATEQLTKSQQLQLSYWTALRSFLQQHNSFLRPHKPRPQQWLSFTFAPANLSILLAASMNIRDQRLLVRLSLSGINAKQHFHALLKEKMSIEREIEASLEWKERLGYVESHIDLTREHADPAQRQDWPEQHAWFQQKLEAFHGAFAPRIKNLASLLSHADTPQTSRGSGKAAIFDRNRMARTGSNPPLSNGENETIIATEKSESVRGGLNRKPLAINIAGQMFVAKTIPDLYKQVLVYLHDNGFLKTLSLPIATGSKRYLLAKEPKHQRGNQFVMDVEYKGYHMEAHKNRTTAMLDLGKLLKLCALSFDETASTSPLSDGET